MVISFPFSIEINFHLGLNLWKLTEENRLINKALNFEWKYGHRKWAFDCLFNVVFTIDTISVRNKQAFNVLEIICPNTNLDINKKVQDGTEVDLQMLKEETDEDSRFQKWELQPESFISRKIQYKRRKQEWMKIKSLWNNSGQEKYLEVSHCGKLLTIQGELITKKNPMNTDFFKKIV